MTQGRSSREAQAEATNLFIHYMTITMRKAGMKVDSDTYAELGQCIECIVEASAKLVTECMVKAEQQKTAASERQEEFLNSMREP